jgi:membrane protein implicated in regulation of membrane protease activity
MPPTGPMDRRLRTSGLLLISGLLVEGLCLLWARPIAFVVLVSLGGALIAAGVLFFLYSLLFVSHSDREERLDGREAG